MGPGSAGSLPRVLGRGDQRSSVQHSLQRCGMVQGSLENAVRRGMCSSICTRGRRVHFNRVHGGRLPVRDQLTAKIIVLEGGCLWVCMVAAVNCYIIA